MIAGKPQKCVHMIIFDHYYEGYEDWYKTKTGLFVDTVETLAAFSLLNPQSGQKILDLGCGTGIFSLKLAALGCTVTGVDISANMLSIAREKTGRNDTGDIDFFEMDGNHLLFADNTFDAVLSMAAFEFINTPQQVFSEMLRVVKPGGVIVIGTIQKGGAWAKLYSSQAMSGSAYEYAVFKDLDDLKNLGPAESIHELECLFSPPGLSESEYDLQHEEHLKTEGAIGGFVCVKYQKAK